MALLDPYGRPFGTDVEVDTWAERGRGIRQDAWVNQQTGLGVWGIDKSKAAHYWPVYRVLDQELTSLMNGSDIASKIVSKRVDEQFRRGWELEGSVNGTPLKQQEVKDAEDWATEYLDLHENFREGARWGRLYGGALNIMAIDDGGELTEPLNENNIRDFYSLALVDRRYSYVQSQYAAMAASRPGYKYGRPQIYLISNAIAGYGWNEHGPVEKISERELRQRGAQVSLVHESRVIRFDGNPADVVTRQQLAGWSWSVLQRVYDAMRQFDTSFDSAMYLLQDASQGVFKLQGLIKAVSTGQRAALLARMQMMEMTRSVVRGIAVDAGGPDGKNAESFERQPTPFSGIPELLQVMMLRLSAAADMPATELFGRAPQGMNATGESDTRKWYDTIESLQKNELGPKLIRVMKLLGLAKKGPLRGKLVDWKIHFRPLQSPTDAELATTRLANAQRDVAYIGVGVVKPEEVAVDLTEVYPNLDVEAREEVLEAGLMFDPYENEPPPQNSPAVNAPGQGEPLSPKAPVPLMGTTGTNIDPGALPQLGKSTPASSGEAGREPGKPEVAKQAKADSLMAAEDSAALLVLDALVATRQDGKQAKAVFQQLLDDYPASHLGWVLAAHWDGPLEVPTEDIDSSNRAQWRASHDGTSESFKQKVGLALKGDPEGIRKPAVLVKVPGESKLRIVDGHHRYLAHEALGAPLLAYVAEVHVKNGPWDELHTAQKKGKSGARSGSVRAPSWAGANAKADGGPRKWTLAEARAASEHARATGTAEAHTQAAQAHRYLAGRLHNLKQDAAAAKHEDMAAVHEAALA
jgi:phage-related protein (TIGR01555 family)